MALISSYPFCFQWSMFIKYSSEGYFKCWEHLKSLLFLYISAFKSSGSSSCKHEDSLNVLYFLYCLLFGGILEKYDRKNERISLWWSLRPVLKMPDFKKLLGLFVSNISIDVPVVFLKHVFPFIMFFKEKVSQRSDK